MAVSDVNQLQMAVSSSTTSFSDLIDSQKELIQSQIEHLQNLVVAQCKLTGVNPLSQEMAAGALSIKIGKRPRDLLNPKAMKYMQSFFSIKDATNKRESREISALFGVTATQVREFFNGQRSRVRRFVRLSGEKANRSNKCQEQEGPLFSDPNVPSNTLPLNTMAPINAEGPSCSTQDEDVPPGLNDLDKHFVENIFTLMRKEDKFSGQVKLMEWILQIQDSTVLHWFLTKGGVMILATWLGQAAMEEQTTVLHVIIKVLCHLPLHKALPAHMSAILQSVNKLRFYRSSDISNRARVLLSKWSKIFARSQNLKKSNAVKSTSECQDEMLLKQSIGEIMGSESWEKKADNLDPANKGYSGTENLRKLDSSQPVKLLTSSADDSNKKLVRGSASHTRERRKVQLVEQPGQKVTGRSSQLARPLPATQERPLSADEIQKAKLRAQFMQTKYGKPIITSDGSPKKVPHPQVSMSQATSRSNIRAKIEEHKKPTTNEPKLDPVSNKMNQDAYEPVSKKTKRVQISWQTPPEMRINSGWMVGTGVNSKEVEFQRNRIRREKEIIYKTIHEIPSDPKEPWDREIDYDDSLTPEIPIEQLPDAEGTENTVSQSQSEEARATSTATTSQSSNGNGNMPEPDFELLAVLLKNPDLVFALTSAEGGGNLSSQDTMKLLDMLKSNGVSSAVGSLTGVGTKAEEKIEVSLPSPTPSSNPVTSAWGAAAKNPFSWQPATVYGEESHMSAVTATIQSQVYSTGMVLPQRPVIAPSPAEPIVTQTPMYQRAISATFPENRARVAVPLLNQTAPEILHNQNNFTVSNLGPHNSLAAPSSMPHLMQTSARSQMRQPSADIPEPQFPTASWRDRQSPTPNSEFHTNYNNNYNAYAGGTQQAPTGHPRNRNEMIGDLRYNTWSPDNSPVRSQQSGWSYGQPRTNNGQNYRVDRSRQQLQPRHPEYRDHSRNDERRWRDQRR